MNSKYIDLINQTFDFPQEGDTLDNTGFKFHGVDLLALVEYFCSPLKFTYLPRRSKNVERDATIAAPLIFTYLLDI